MRAALLTLADGRFPGGGHAHSGGLEAAASAGSLTDLDSLSAFLAGRLATTGANAAGLAAAASSGVHSWDALDSEADARSPSAAQRVASRKQGRSLVRAAARIWPTEVLDTLGGRKPHYPVAIGAAASAAGLSPDDAALAAAHAAVTGPASACVRLLSLDPVEVTAIVASLGPAIDAVAARSAALAFGPLRDLPCEASPLLEIGAEWHASWEVRLFAS
jgi:urease accessory protein